MRNKLNLLMGIFLASTLMMTMSCSEDEGGEKESLIGTYKITSATLVDPVTSDFTGVEGASLDAGTNITSAIVSSFLGEIECFDASAKGITLTDGNKIFYECLSEDKEEEKGSWSVNSDRSELTLSLNIQNQLVPLVLTDLQEFDGGLSGIVASIPVPPALLSAVNGEFLKVQLAGIPISLDLTFTKQ